MDIGRMMIMVGIDMVIDNNVIIITQADQTHLNYKGEKIYNVRGEICYPLHEDVNKNRTQVKTINGEIFDTNR